MIAVFGESTLKIYEDAGYIKMDIPFCSQAYLCQTFLRSRYPDKQEREAVCREYGIDDSYDFKFIYSDDEYDEAMEARNDSYVAAARHFSASCRWTEILLMRIMSMPILRSISALPMPFSGAWRMAMSLWAKDFFEA